MDEHKRNILIIAATTAAIILLAGVNIAHILATSTPRTSEAEETTSTAAIGGTGTSAPKRKTAVEHQKPLEVCERLAPKAAAAYTSKGEDRDRLVKQSACPPARSRSCTRTWDGSTSTNGGGRSSNAPASAGP